VNQVGDPVSSLRPSKSIGSRVFAAVQKGAEQNATVGERILTAGVLLVLACLFFLPSAFYVTPGFGSEDSWRLTINKAVTEGWGFGNRIIWTYGPLGFYETRCPYGISPFCFAGFDLFVLLVFVLLAFDALKLQVDSAVAWACVITLFTCKRLVHDQASSALYCVIVFLLIRNLSKPGMVNSAGLVIASVLGLFVKVNFGLVSVFLCGLIFLIKAAAREKSAVLWMALLLAQIVSAWALAAVLHTNLIAYVNSALAIVKQYGDGMAWGPLPEWAPRGFGISHVAVCVFFWVFVIAAVGFIRKRGFSREPLLYLLIGGIATFVLYKTSVVRSDYNHNKCFLLGFPIIALAFLMHGPESLRSIWRWFFLASTAYAGLLLIAEFGNSLIYLQKDYLKSFFPVNYVKGIADYESVRDWQAYTNYALSKFPERAVPENFAQFVGTNRVDVFPFEATLPLGRGMNFQPRPVPQTYVAMGKELEGRNLAYYQSERAPRFIFYVLGDKAFSPDGRYPLWEEPAVKRELQAQYALRGVFNNLQGAQPETEPKISSILVLERNPAASSRKEEIVATKMERAGEEFTLPEEGEELYAKIKIKKTLLGRLVSFLYRGARVDARFRLADGTERRGRIIPANLETGVLVNFFVDAKEAEKMKNYLCSHSQGNPKCVELRIDYLHEWEYQRQFEVTYYRQVEARH
jgi:hypothetical protein